MTDLKLMTFNLGLPALRPLGLKAVSFAQHVDERLAAMPDHLGGAGADIIAFQEVFAKPHQEFLRTRLSKIYPHACSPTRLPSLLGSGLMVLSRYPIGKSRFFPWRAAPTIDNSVSARGCQYVEVDLPGHGPLGLLNLHIRADDPFVRTKQNGSGGQLAEIDSVLGTAHSLGSPSPILMGDFNCDAVLHPTMYSRIVESGYIDVFDAIATLEQRRNAVTWDNTNTLNASGRYRNTPSQRIDHIFVPRSLADVATPLQASIEFVEPAVKSKAGCPVTLSDHYALIAHVRINRNRP